MTPDEKRAKRIHDITYSTADRAELAERMVALEELCGDLFNRLMDEDEICGECRSQCEHDAWNFGDPKCVYAKRMSELGLEVDE